MFVGVLFYRKAHAVIGFTGIHHSMHQKLPRWSIAVFAARESLDTLKACIRAAVNASKNEDVVIDVLVNGNRALAEQTAQLPDFAGEGHENVVVRVWFISTGDKAHTWNEYVHRIWQGGMAYFIDGYAEVREDALSFIEAGLNDVPNALGATGVPTSGRSAAALRQLMLKEGGIHGNLYAIRGTVMSTLRERGFRLPLGLYRTDSLIGAVLVYQLDPSQNTWDTKRMFVHPQATWHVQQTGMWKPKDIWGQCKRKLRQAQGILENRAVRQHLAVEKRLPETLPHTISELVGKWIAACPQDARHIFLKHPITLYAARKLRQPRDWSDTNILPILLSSRP
jgi:hypothetical protein